ncbi:hypothetical protein HOK68_00775 [Candidatus Woesearchaeota archaeon]|nr:hypothetical protein [Candidatus Woesearchaeota archaeon]MBT4387778.1 hypothetical protein [Candidatus Woesearchaeota archaeon]MBT4595597.1 hypothetical protein [Candidatus Woesearchaeota archaeon]MBT5740920.1 hypothetical protein [Candidatus Woesearchaeota archaeon]MBT6505294.1 hypothetical protein [Candidatus Woesearchaeota archaeon]
MFKLWGIFNAVYYGGKKNYFNPFELKARFQFMMFFWPAFFGRKTNFPLEFYYNLKVVKWCLLAIIILMFIAAII